MSLESKHLLSFKGHMPAGRSSHGSKIDYILIFSRFRILECYIIALSVFKHDHYCDPHFISVNGKLTSA